jgi:hypothetical protein
MSSATRIEANARVSVAGSRSADQRGDRLPAAEADPEVPGEGPARPTEVLRDQRLVQAGPCEERVVGLLVETRAEGQPDRIARHQLDQAEHDDAHPRQDDERLADPAEEVAGQGSSTLSKLIALSARIW